jgi:hypothetical protein
VTDPTETPRPSVRAVQYKGEPLDAERGPGLGCFRFQLVLLAVLVVLTPLSAWWEWPPAISALLLLATLVLLLFAGQTIIFLLRLVAADRRAERRRRPLASRTPTVGELEDAISEEVAEAASEKTPGTPADEPASTATEDASDEGPVRQ